jgi:AcrR family transcriptional regulator
LTGCNRERIIHFSMPQRRKDEVDARIARAALEVFAREGYERSTVAAIAEAAGISTGNVYRYHASKEALFDAVVPAPLVERFRSLLGARLAAAGRGFGEEWALASAELNGFVSEHRLAVLVVLGRAAGSRWAHVRAEVEAELVHAALAYGKTHRRDFRASTALRFALRRVYASFVDTIVDALATFDDDKRLRAAIEAFSAYHQAGMRALILG